ncbi:IS91 family transposase [Ideonella sp. DXS22W]|uniref:IS91 family transposase n=1 Tax=Pseudaquabacterium inlustre TaxID=2984192 RepID=A0ABU9CMG7_9BURK
MPTTLAEVLRRFGPAVLAQRHAEGRELAPVQARAWAAITQCRTPALGGQLLRCDGCQAEQWRWHACRNRHCPQCQTRQREAWRRARGAELLNVPYCHLVFTLPHELNPLAAARPRWLYDTLLDTVASTLTTFAADPKWLGGTGAFTLVLHTWAQDLSRHLHVHVLMACGALSSDGQGQPHWQTPRRSPTFLFPVRALSQVWRARFIDTLVQAQSSPRPCVDATGRPMPLPLQALCTKPWVVYAKTPLAGPAAVLDYLSRYTHRTAIGNERLLGIHGDQVRFRTRVNRKHAAADAAARATTATNQPRSRVTQLPGPVFIERLLQHVVPRGFKRIRHYGLLAPAAKRSRLACARALLGMPAVHPEVSEDVAQFMRRVAAVDIQTCAHCGQGRWHAVACQAPEQAMPVHNLTHAPRGPP